MKLDVKLFKRIETLVDEGYILKNKHFRKDYFIYNYSQFTQFERKWEDATLMSRGLILDSSGEIIARPFRKFFNYEELNGEIPNEPFEVFEKYDGSLGILYWLKEQPCIATRGSFESDQADKGAEILWKKYHHTFKYLDKSKTYLFEIIYPQNRIVIDYGGMEDIVLLAVIDNVTGEDVDIPKIGFPIVKRYDGIKDISKLREIDGLGREGFVVKFQNGLRIKLKYEEYVRLHRLFTQTNPKHIWACMKEGDISKILDNVPDEFYQWAKNVIGGLQGRYDTIEQISKNDFKDHGDRKTNALYYQKCKHPAILFMMLDNKDYSERIWKLIKPRGDEVFKIEI